MVEELQIWNRRTSYPVSAGLGGNEVARHSFVIWPRSEVWNLKGTWVSDGSDLGSGCRMGKVLTSAFLRG